MYQMVNGFLGEDALMYASDYPHSECQFPNSIDNILAWQSLKPQTQQNSSKTTPTASTARRDATASRRWLRSTTTLETTAPPPRRGAVLRFRSVTRVHGFDLD